MSTLLLKFGINLEEYDISTVTRHYGPLFHRWLPDGEEDAIVLDTGDPNAKLRVWFERRGFIDNGFIRFSYERREIDPKIIPTQAILDAGPIMGLLEIKRFSEEESAALRENKIGDAYYIALAKRVVKKLIYPSVARFLNVLRTNYGQYWISELKKWDSNKESLGSYCSSLGLKWSLDDGKTWAHFIPNKPEIMLTTTIRQSYTEYLTKEDWQELAKVAREKYEPSPAAFVLSLAHRFMDQGDLKHAFIEGVSALEIALNEFVHQKLDNDNGLLEPMKAFWTLPLRAQIITITIDLDKVTFQDIKDTINAIKIRNEIVHEGLDPPINTKNILSGLLNTVSALLLGPTFSFPSANPGNAIMSVEKWEEREHDDPYGG